MRTWETLVARARGLSGRLLPGEVLEDLARAPDLPGLAGRLDEIEYGRSGSEVSGRALESRVRRVAAARMRILARWNLWSPAALRFAFEDEDRRGLRGLIRGAAAGCPPESRIADAIPTPLLPERALQELARQATPRAVAALLTAWGVPYGSAILEEAGRPAPDLFRLELAIDRVYFRRALQGARRGGGFLHRYLRLQVDLQNIRSGLALSDRPEGGPDPEDCFIPGGQHIDVNRFLKAIAQGNPAGAGLVLSGAMAGTTLAAVIERHAADPLRFEAEVLETLITRTRREALRSPLGPAPFIGYLLRLRSEVRDLRRIIWGVAMQAPKPLRVGGGVAAW